MVAPTVIAATLAGAARAELIDHPLQGRTLKVRSTGIREYVKYAAHPPIAALSTFPTVEGGSLLIFNPMTGESSGELVCPPTAWKANPGKAVYKCSNRLPASPACDALTMVVLKGQGKLKAKAKCLGSFRLDEETQGSLSLVLTIGSARYCSSFSGGSVRADRPGLFAAADAPAPAGDECPQPPPPLKLVRLVSTPSGGVCGSVQDANGAHLIDVLCGTTSFGGGSSLVPMPVELPGGNLLYARANCADGLCDAVEVRPAAETDVPGPGCPTPPGTPSFGARHCTAPGCYVGAPLPVHSGGTSKCGINRVADLPGAGTGSILTSTGSATVELPLISDMYLTGNGAEPCPTCNGGTVGVCGSGTCRGGGRDGLPCTPELGPDGMASHDCSIDDQGVHLGTFPTFLQPPTVTTDAVQLDVQACPRSSWSEGGAFSLPDAAAISAQGTTAGDLLDWQAHPIVAVGAFCIPATGNGLVDGSADLPGPGVAALNGTIELIR